MIFQVMTIDLGTELAPAITLAYEPSERDIMRMPPRKRTQHLMTWPLIFYAYLVISSFITAGCFLAYFWVFWMYDIHVADLFWSGTNKCGEGCWQPPNSYVNATRNPSHECGVNTTERSYDFQSNGRCFDVFDQDQIQREACTAFYLSIVMGQVKAKIELNFAKTLFR